MYTEPPKRKNDQADSAFQVNAEDQPQQKRKKHEEEGDSIVDEVVEELTDGCLWRIISLPLRLLTLPFRLVWKIVEEIFD